MFKKILVTGSSGFIGRHLFKQLASQFPESQLVGISRRSGVYPHEIPSSGISTIHCDLTQTNRVADLMLRYQPDAVFHLAGNPIIKPQEYPLALTRDNIISTHNLLAYCNPGTRFVLASSLAVYGDSICRYETEMKPTSVYGATKAAAEHLVRAYTAMGDIKGLCLRYGATVGRGTTHGLFHDIIIKLRGPSKTLVLFGDFPGTSKPQTHIDDVVDGTILMATQDVELANLCLSDSVTVDEVAQNIMWAMKITKPINWLGKSSTWKGDNPKVQFCSVHAEDFGWSPRYTKSNIAVSHAALEVANGVP
jgi:UDP-glucose 4-epimerase